MRSISLLLFSFLLISCSSSTTEDIPAKVDQLIVEDNYQKAIELVEGADSSKTDANLAQLKEKTYLNYGLYLEYRGPEENGMRERMTSALQQFIKVLKINQENEKARSEIDNIMAVYKTMPDRSPGDEIISELQELGFDY